MRVPSSHVALFRVLAIFPFIFVSPLQVAGQPTDAEVMAAHAEYIERLRSLFDEHKNDFGYGNRELIVS